MHILNDFLSVPVITMMAEVKVKITTGETLIIEER